MKDRETFLCHFEFDAPRRAIINELLDLAVDLFSQRQDSSRAPARTYARRRLPLPRQYEVVHDDDGPRTRTSRGFAHIMWICSTQACWCPAFMFCFRIICRKGVVKKNCTNSRKIFLWLFVQFFFHRPLTQTRIGLSKKTS